MSSKISLRLVLACVGGYYLLLAGQMYFSAYMQTSMLSDMPDSEMMEAIINMAVITLERSAPILLAIAGSYLLFALVYPVIKRLEILIQSALTVIMVFWFKDYIMISGSVSTELIDILEGGGRFFETFSRISVSMGVITSVFMYILPLLLIWVLILFKDKFQVY